MASVRIERLEEMFADMRRFFAEEATRLEAEGIAIMTEVHEIVSRDRGTDDQGEEG